MHAGLNAWAFVLYIEAPNVQVELTPGLQQIRDTPSRWLSIFKWGPNVGRCGLYCNLCDFRRDACPSSRSDPHLRSPGANFQTPENCGPGTGHASSSSCASLFHDYLYATTGWVHVSVYGASREVEFLQSCGLHIRGIDDRVLGGFVL